MSSQCFDCLSVQWLLYRSFRLPIIDVLALWFASKPRPTRPQRLAEAGIRHQTLNEDINFGLHFTPPLKKHCVGSCRAFLESSFVACLSSLVNVARLFIIQAIGGIFDLLLCPLTRNWAHLLNGFGCGWFVWPDNVCATPLTILNFLHCIIVRYVGLIICFMSISMFFIQFVKHIIKFNRFLWFGNPF